MSWFLIGVLLGTSLLSTHETREACEGRAVLLREKGALVKCVDVGGMSSNTFIVRPPTN